MRQVGTAKAWLRRAAFGGAAFIGLFSFGLNLLVLRTYETADPLAKDLVQDLLAARMAWEGGSPYGDLPALGARYIGIPLALRHPTPHPPSLLLLAMPLTFLDLRLALWVWFFFQVGLLFALAAALLRLWGTSPTLPARLGLGLALAGWYPVFEDLLYAQMNLLIAFLVAVMGISMRRGRELQAGALLGLAIALKLFLGPLALTLLLYRRWRAAAAALATALALHLLAGAVIGWESLRDYYLRVAPMVADLYRPFSHNLSAWSLGDRLFAGTVSRVIPGLDAPPPIPAPHLAPVASTLAVLGLLLFGLRQAWRVRDLEQALALMTPISILASPIAWDHYLTILAMPLTIAARRGTGCGKWMRLGGVLILLSLPLGLVDDGVRALLGSPSVLPPWAPWLSFLPAAGAFGLAWILGRIAPSAEAAR